MVSLFCMSVPLMNCYMYCTLELDLTDSTHPTGYTICSLLEPITSPIVSSDSVVNSFPGNNNCDSEPNKESIPTISKNFQTSQVVPVDNAHTRSTRLVRLPARLLDYHLN